MFKEIYLESFFDIFKDKKLYNFLKNKCKDNIVDLRILKRYSIAPIDLLKKIYPEKNIKDLLKIAKNYKKVLKLKENINQICKKLGNDIDDAIKFGLDNPKVVVIDKILDKNSFVYKTLFENLNKFIQDELLTEKFIKERFVDLLRNFLNGNQLLALYSFGVENINIKKYTGDICFKIILNDEKTEFNFCDRNIGDWWRFFKI
jgi:hypothetical protein